VRKRIIPVLQISSGKLVKTQRFKKPRYIGDPINAVKIFNEKGVDELILLDISATSSRREPDYELIQAIASEAFMPLCYGGGVSSLKQMNRLFSLGIEKIAMNNATLTNMDLVKAASTEFGSQSIIASVNLKRGFIRRNTIFIFDYLHMCSTKLAPTQFIESLEAAGVGELLVTSVDQDGMLSGYEIEAIRLLSTAAQIPLIAMGAAGNLDHVKQLFANTEASAAAAGSMFVFQGPHKAVLIQYPEEFQVAEIFHAE